MRISNIQVNKLDIGCGRNKIDGFTGLDKRDYGQEIVWDVRHGIPLPNDSVEEIYTSHFVEHLREHEIILVVREMLRVCSNGAKIMLICPHSECPEAYFGEHYTRWHKRRIDGLCLGSFGQLSLVDLKIEGIDLKVNLIVNKK